MSERTNRILTDLLADLKPLNPDTPITAGSIVDGIERELSVEPIEVIKVALDRTLDIAMPEWWPNTEDWAREIWTALHEKGLVL